MDLTASMLTQHNQWAVAYHPDGDGFGTVNILRNHLPNGKFRFFSVDNAMRDFDEDQYKELLGLIEQGYQVLYLDLTPSNVPQLQEIIARTPLYYLDHHQLSPGFKGLLGGIYANNPRIFAPDNANAYAAGLQIFQLLGEADHDLPYLFVSLFGDAKFDDWPAYQSKLAPHHNRLAVMADALSSVGLTKPVGPYNPTRTDKLFDDASERVRAGYAANGMEGFFAGFDASDLAREYVLLKAQIATHYEAVKSAIANETRAIAIEDERYILSPILLKEAYKLLDFTGPYILYQVDQKADIVQYAVMSKNSDYDCARHIHESPHVTGGGHTDRAGCTGPIPALSDALAHFLQAYA